MHRRYLIVALALVVALAAITPTLGATGTQSLVEKSSFPVRTAKKAKQIAKRAKQIANQALTAANAAQTTADTAQTAANTARNAADAAQASANQAKTSADNAQAAANAAQTSANQAQTAANNAQASADAVAAQLAGLQAKSDTDPGTVTTADENAWIDLGGPSVTVTVPPSGLIEAVAQADVDIDGAVSLFEDGQPMAGQDPNGFCDTTGGLVDVLLSNEFGPPGAPLTLSTPGGPGPVGACGSVGAGAPNVFQTSPGTHTYTLRYGDCGCDPGIDAEFSNRTLTVAPRP
jgi:hypothetical protein